MRNFDIVGLRPFNGCELPAWRKQPSVPVESVERTQVLAWLKTTGGGPVTDGAKWTGFPRTWWPGIWRR